MATPNGTTKTPTMMPMMSRTRLFVFGGGGGQAAAGWRVARASALWIWITRSSPVGDPGDRTRQERSTRSVAPVRRGVVKLLMEGAKVGDLA